MDLFWHRLIFKKELFPDTTPPETIVNQKLLKIKTEAKKRFFAQNNYRLFERPLPLKNKEFGLF